MPHVIETASSGRAKCRGCGQLIGKGDLRFGERLPNPYGEGDATYWFHVRCGACRRPETFAEALAQTEAEIPERERLAKIAQLGIDHYRLGRLARAQRDPSGRARCRYCRELIEKGAWRLALEVWEDGRFSSMGYIHAPCATGYFGTSDIMFGVRNSNAKLTAEEIEEIERSLVPQ